MRRGRYSGADRTRSEKRPASQEANPSIFDRLKTESRVKNETAKEALAMTAVALMEEIGRLRTLAKSSKITADEARAFPAVASNLRRTLDALGLLGLEEDQEDLLA